MLEWLMSGEFARIWKEVVAEYFAVTEKEPLESCQDNQCFNRDRLGYIPTRPCGCYELVLYDKHK
jgi:hypothetical protein